MLMILMTKANIPSIPAKRVPGTFSFFKRSSSATINRPKNSRDRKLKNIPRGALALGIGSSCYKANTPKTKLPNKITPIPNFWCFNIDILNKNKLNKAVIIGKDPYNIMEILA